MRGIAAIATALLFILHALPALSSQESAASGTSQIVLASQQSLEQQDVKKAQSLVEEGLRQFPNDTAWQGQLARVDSYDKHDRHAIDLLNKVLRADAANRDAKLELAHIFGYRQNYAASDRLYRELLAADPDDEAASLGLVHNLILEGKRVEARQQVKQSLDKHPGSLGLQQYSDYLVTHRSSEGQRQYFHRIQAEESFFSDSSGNRSFYSSQGFACDFSQKFTTRSIFEETSLWKPGVGTQTIASGGAEARFRLNSLVTLRAGSGGVRFSDGETHPLYSGDLDLHPWKNLLISGGYFRSYVAPTVDASFFDLLTHGWRTRVDYRTRNLSVTGNLFLRHYSDGNHSEREYAEVLRWFGIRSFSIGGGYAFRHQHFSEDLNHGYFSPGQYRSHLAAAGIRFHIGKIYRAEYLGYGGAEILKGLTDYTPAGELLLKNDFTLGRWNLGADYSHFHLLQTTGAFRADSATVNLGYKF